MLFRVLLIWCIAFSVSAQDIAQRYGNLITADELRDHLTILASDALEGRATGSRGQKMAAAFIAAHFEEIGLVGPVNGSYYQPLVLYTTANPKVSFSVGNVALKEMDEFVYFGSGDTNGPKQLPLVFAGRGTEADLQQVDVKGKAAVIMLDANASMRSSPGLLAVREKEAALVIAVIEQAEEFKTTANQIRTFARGRMSLTKGSPSANLGTFIITGDAAGRMFKSTPKILNKAVVDKTLAKVKPQTLDFSISPAYNEIKTENVLGFLQGTDKKDEVIVITAHYDHIGIRSSGEGDRINNGADDDGSGTVAVMNLAKAFVQAKKDGVGPRRSILFMTVTAEEVGLLGSRYYTDISPVFPLEKTVVNLNIDMIGRTDPPHKDSPPFVYVVGSDKLSAELHTISEEANKKYSKLIFDYTYNDEKHPERIYYRSDHWNFAKNNVPIIFYTNGTAEDYHKPSDEVDKIEFDLLTLRTQCIFYTAWEIANREARIKSDKK